MTSRARTCPIPGSAGGFTLIELIVIIVVLITVAVAAIPAYVDLSASAKQSAEQGVVGNIRSGINLYYANQAASGDPRYPALLDTAVNSSTASDTNPFFTSVLSQGAVTRDWTKNSSGNYVGPAGGVYTYVSATGQFVLP